MYFLDDAELKSIMTRRFNAYVFVGDELKSVQLKNTLLGLSRLAIRTETVLPISSSNTYVYL